MSYSTFALTTLKLNKTEITKDDKIEVSCTLQNTGKICRCRSGTALFAGCCSQRYPPVKELKDFKKVFLQPGESKEISFMIDKEKLSFYDQKMNWGTEPGEFKLMIGNSSDNIILESSFELLN